MPNDKKIQEESAKKKVAKNNKAVKKQIIKNKKQLDKKNKRLSKDQMKDLIKAKQRINDATQDKKADDRVKEQIQKKEISNPKLLTFKVVTDGIENKFDEADVKYQDAVKVYKKHKTTKAKANLSLAKMNYLKENKNINDEVKQINTLNKRPKGKVKLPNESDELITVRGLNKYYAQKHMIFMALDDVNISIKKGTFNVILGPSGSGKTTLLNAISGLDRATFGDIIVNGTNISALSTNQLTQFRRKHIGFVFQSYNLLQSLNVSDNIEIGRSLQTNQNKRKNVKELLNSIDMEHALKKRTYELSGGQQQRVSIARALSKSPDILIGDEPTGALDQVTSAKVFELFQEINRKQKATVIIVTHNVNVAKLAHQVIHVNNGRISKVTQNSSPMPARNLIVK